VNQPIDPYQAPAGALADAPAAPLALRTAGKGRRFLTYLIDYAVSMVVMLLVFIALALMFGEQVLGGITRIGEFAFAIGIAIAYYLFFEALWGRTPGKYVCGTVVVDDSGRLPTFWQVLGRTFARFIPFEPFSLLFSDDDDVSGWHDTLPGTRVVLVPGRG
jgi:uncharacterized RDD family membrane protein YckC